MLLTTDDEMLDAAKEAMGHWSIEWVSVDLIARVENTVFKVTDRSGIEFVLRFHRPGYHDLAQLESEQVWTEALALSGLGVPRRVRSTGGQRYVQCHIGKSSATYFAGVSEWFAGETMEELIAASRALDNWTQYFTQLGELAAKIHNQSSTWRAPKDFTRHHLDVEGFLGSAPWWGRFWESSAFDARQKKQLIPVRAALREILTKMPQSPDVYSLIHADLHPGNVLVDGERLHIIDFDDAGFGWHAYELAVALYPYRTHRNYLDLENAIMRGYCRHRPAGEAIAQAIPIFFLIRTLAQIGWYEQRPELEGQRHARELVGRVFELAEQVM